MPPRRGPTALVEHGFEVVLDEPAGLAQLQGVVAAGDHRQATAQVVHVTEGQGQLALGVRGHHVQGGGGGRVGLQQLGPGEVAHVLQALGGGDLGGEVDDIAVPDRWAPAVDDDFALFALLQVGLGSGQGLSRVLPGPAHPAHDDHRPLGDAALRPLWSHQGHDSAAGLAQIDAGQAEETQVEPALSGVAEEELVRGGDGAQGLDSGVLCVVLPGGLEQARGVEVDDQRRDPRQRRGLLGLDADDAVGAHGGGVAAQLGGVGEAGRAALDHVLVAGDVEHLVTGCAEGLAVVPGADGATAAGTVFSGQPTVKDDEDAHATS